jgi:hypothetical protein
MTKLNFAICIESSPINRQLISSWTQNWQIHPFKHGNMIMLNILFDYYVLYKVNNRIVTNIHGLPVVMNLWDTMIVFTNLLSQLISYPKIRCHICFFSGPTDDIWTDMMSFLKISTNNKARFHKPDVVTTRKLLLHDTGKYLQRF